MIMKKQIALTFLIFILSGLLLNAQEPEVKILAMPESPRMDRITLRDGTKEFVHIRMLNEGQGVFAVRGFRRFNLRWSEIESIELSKFSLGIFSPNWGKPIPVTCDSTKMEDRIIMKDGTAVVGTIFDFVRYYRVRLETGPLMYKKCLWDGIRTIELGKGSPFIAYSTDSACSKGQKVETPAQVSMHKVNANKIQASSYQELSTDQIRKAWQIRGGPIFSQEVNASYTMLSAKPSGMTMRGNGVSSNFAANFINLKPPSYASGVSNMSALKIGVNASFQALILNVTFPDPTFKIDYAMMSSITLGLNFGYQYGIGKFLNSKEWKGTVIGFAWRPTLQLTSSSMGYSYEYTILGNTYTGYGSSSDSSTDFNAKGYEFFVDFADLEAITSRFVKPAHFKVFAIFLPPVGDMKMTFFQIGFGLVTY